MFTFNSILHIFKIKLYFKSFYFDNSRKFGDTGFRKNHIIDISHDLPLTVTFTSFASVTRSTRHYSKISNCSIGANKRVGYYIKNYFLFNFFFLKNSPKEF